MNLNGRVPNAKQRFVLDAIAFPQPVQPGPAVGVDEGLENIGIVGPVFVHPWQRGLAQHQRRGLHFPKQLLGLGVSEIVKVLDLNDVQSALSSAGVVGFDRPHGRKAVANPHGLADFGWWGWSVFHCVLFLPKHGSHYTLLILAIAARIYPNSSPSSPAVSARPWTLRIRSSSSPIK